MFPIYLNENENELPPDDICYIIAKDGIYLKKTLGIIESVAKVDKISILPTLKTKAKMHIKKIPSHLVGQVFNFFKQVYTLHYSEAVVLLFYNENKKQYKIVYPKQVVSAASIHEYERDITIKNYSMIGTIHSHGMMSAFHSGTDKMDEEMFDGLHITFGNLNNNDYITISTSIVINGNRVLIEAEDYLEGVQRVTEEPPINTVLQNTYTSTLKYVVDGTDPRSLIGEKELSKVEKYVFKPKFVTYYNTNRTPYDWSNNIPGYSPLNVGPCKFSGITFPSHDLDADGNEYNPCLTCPHIDKKIKLQMEDEITMEDVYRCEKCGTFVEENPLNEFATCPKCKTDDYLFLIDEDDLAEYKKQKENTIKCASCGNIFPNEEKLETCPFCNSLINRKKYTYSEHNQNNYFPNPIEEISYINRLFNGEEITPIPPPSNKPQTKENE